MTRFGVRYDQCFSSSFVDEEYTGHIVRDKRVTTSLSLTYEKSTE